LKEDFIDFFQKRAFLYADDDLIGLDKMANKTKKSYRAGQLF
jgi:hypothetical protein